MNPPAKEFLINNLVLKRPYTRADLGMGRVGGPGEELLIKREQVHGRTRCDVFV